MSQFEQHTNIKFMCRLGKSASETLSALQQVYGDTAQKKSTVYDWFSWFKNGQKLEDDQRSGRPLPVMSRQVVVQLVEAMHYEPKCRRFDSQWCHSNFSLT
jgi:transposase